MIDRQTNVAKSRFIATRSIVGHMENGDKGGA